MSKSKNPETIALHGGEYRSDPATTAVAVPIYRTTSYQFNNTGHAANLFALKDVSSGRYSFVSANLYSFEFSYPDGEKNVTIILILSKLFFKVSIIGLAISNSPKEET